MTYHPQHAEQSRTRLGLLFLAVGVVLLLWSWGHWVYRASVPLETEGVPAEHVAAPSLGTVRAVRFSPLVLMVGLLLVLGFLVGSYVMVRTWRRYRAVADRQRPKPTFANDVWAMHKQRNHDDEI